MLGEVDLFMRVIGRGLASGLELLSRGEGERREDECCKLGPVELHLGGSEEEGEMMKVPSLNCVFYTTPAARVNLLLRSPMQTCDALVRRSPQVQFQSRPPDSFPALNTCIPRLQTARKDFSVSQPINRARL